MIITVAHSLETQKYKAHKDVLITGVGTSIMVTRLVERLKDVILNKKPVPLLINVGTCCSVRKEDVGKVIIPLNFIYRNDFNLEYSYYGPTPSIYTSDSFITDRQQLDRVASSFGDMESFAQSRLCKTFGIPFCAVKIVSDYVGNTSSQVWEASTILLQPLIDSIIDKLLMNDSKTLPENQFLWLRRVLSTNPSLEIVS